MSRKSNTSLVPLLFGVVVVGGLAVAAVAVVNRKAPPVLKPPLAQPPVLRRTEPEALRIARAYLNENVGDTSSIEIIRVQDGGEHTWFGGTGAPGGQYPRAIYVKYRAKNQFNALVVFDHAILIDDDGIIQGAVPARSVELIGSAKADKALDDFLKIGQ